MLHEVIEYITIINHFIFHTLDNNLFYFLKIKHNMDSPSC